MIKTIEIKQDMSMLDVCNMAFGNLDNLITLMQENNVTDLINNNDKIVTFDTTYSANVLGTNNGFANQFIFATAIQDLISSEPSLLQQNGFYILQETGFKILL
jgi:hypothetical protein